MGELGDLFEAAYDAPRCRSLHVVGRRFVEWASIERTLREASGGSARVKVVSFGSSSAPSPESTETPFELWWRADGRLRVGEGDTIEVRSGDTVTTFDPLSGTISRPAGDYRTPVVLAVRQLLADLDFRLERTTTWQGRSAWIIATEPAHNAARHGPPTWLFQLTGRNHTLTIDRAIGIVLSAEGRFDDDIVSWMAVDALDADIDIDDAMFELIAPDGTPTRTAAQVTLDHLSAQGHDVGGVDPNDPSAVAAAVQRAFPPPRSHPRRPSIEELAENHPLLGPPPIGEPAARAAVEEAVRGMHEVSGDGADVSTVERGVGLGACVREARRRFPDDANAEIRALHVRFVSDVEAVVWFQVAKGDATLIDRMEGRVVRVGDRWLVSRATFCDLMAMAGVTCPPLV